MNNKVKLDLLYSLTEPRYSRFEFLEAKQKESYYSKKVYAYKLYEVLEHYRSKIQYLETDLNTVGNYLHQMNLDLYEETEGLMHGAFGHYELLELANTVNYLIYLWSENDGINSEQNSELLLKEMKIEPIIWLSDKNLNDFINQLISWGLIICSNPQLIIKYNFNANIIADDFKPIQWNNSNRLLCYFIFHLQKQDIISESKSMWSIIETHFVNKNNESYIIKQLVSDWSNISGYNYKPKGFNLIDKIIDAYK